MNIDKLVTIMLGNNWGTHLADGDNFYRLLFRLEKQNSLDVAEIKTMFASYKAWKIQMNTLVQECHSNSTFEDRKAINYSETLNEDIVKHVNMILSTVKCNDQNFMQELAKMAEKTEEIEQ